LNGNFKEVEIWAATESEPELKKLKVHDFGGAGTPTKVLFDKPLVKPTTIRFVVNSGAGDGQGFASCAEMEFYRSNPDNYDPLQLFTDPSCSALKPGITREVIELVSNNLYRNIAFDLFANRYPAEFRIQEYSAWPNPLVWEKVNKASSQSLLDNPTGIAVSQGEELVVFVGDTHGYNLSIKVQNLDKPGGDGYHSEASFYPLTKGVNKIRTDRKGLVYLFYHTADYEKAPKVKVHFATGKVNGYFDSQKHSDEDWRRLLDGATDKYFDVLGRHSHFTFETAAFKTYTTNGRELTDTYDELVRMEYEFMGLMKYNRLPVNRAYFHIMYSSYMYATAYRTAYLNTLQDLVLSPQRLKKDPWGPAHEMGHTLQTRPGFRWVGTVEVTNNLHSIYVQTQWGNSARLETDAPDRPASVGGKYNNVYERAYYDSFVNGIAHGDDKNDWFCMLVPLWQLQRYFADARGNVDLYKDFYERVRTSPDKETAGEQQLEFVRSMCDLSGYDLTGFFKLWGYLTPVESHKNDKGVMQFRLTNEQIDNLIEDIKRRNYKPMNEKIEYICDSNWEIFKDKKTMKAGTATKKGTEITVSGSENVVAYEAFDGDRLIFATNKNSFRLDGEPKQLKVFALAYDGTKQELSVQ
ncbi:MAG: M60 family metallopeptidase, partial [Proteiniphilum sp.]|jgi:hypothetical protein|nr:M60 family metallopeptidase [Proteiniphilum sp.]